MRATAALAGSAVLALVVATRPLDPLPRNVAIGALAVAWLFPFVFTRRAVGAHGSVVAAIAGVTAAGQIHAGIPYGIGVALFALACVHTLRRARTAGPLPPPRPHALAIVLGVTAAVAIPQILALPPLAARVERRINALLAGGTGSDEETAFSTRMKLGATTGMLQRDTVVLHVDGPTPAYLRGAVYDRYDGGLWTTSGRGRHTRVVPSTPGPRPARIVLPRGAGEGSDMRWFLPPGACDLVTSNASVEIDDFGIARRAHVDDPATIRYRTEGCTPPAIAEPGPNDLDLLRAISPRLTAIATEWTAGAPTPRAKVEAIVHRLAAFEYSLAVPRGPLDPILDFLTVHRAGHCEYFAAALALLARTQGIPTRVVGGYRVSEVNPWTGRAIVRERNAHAWVEVWLDGAWTAFDPTPVSDGPGARATFASNLADLAATSWARAQDALDALGPLGIVAIGAVGVGLWFALRVVRDRLRSRHHAARRGPLERPLPCFERLGEALARAGIARDESEPIEALVARLRQRAEPWAAEAAIALEAYAGLRYGGQGTEPAVVARVEAATRAIG